MLANNGINAAAQEVVTLGGFDTLPVLAFETVVDNIARAEWEFRADGTCFADFQTKTDAQLSAGVIWNNNQPDPVQSYWIKGTQSGVTGPGDVPNTGNTLNVWHSMAVSTRAYGWQVLSGNDTRDGTVRVDISTASDGNPIVATGYFRGIATSTL